MAPTLTAVYRSPLSTEPHIFSYPLPESVASSMATGTDAKTQHLSDLRAAVIKLQEEVNTYLTERMQAEKKAEEDAMAEEKYGEEEGEEED
ncbi:uncharacterized protein H6S33_002185 [Morchella sextelata]|jgi:hypothetical protein|uniref:uncharacterized protein n=1 Tax=Morchella sextelata TaxID=1174677 RepID=UPI001D040D4A|nr:uncharacterized protein H6S33_002185 [Morchella sextelata]KAH0608133.1 hypothetical protein H6S33_002185 [Morchella sextelata]